MIRKEEVYKIGIFNKPHGIHGELSFTFTDDIFDRVEAGRDIRTVLYRRIPFSLRHHGSRQTRRSRYGGTRTDVYQH